MSEDNIKGVLIKPNEGANLNFLLDQEYWDWTEKVFPKYIGKKVEIIIRVAEE